MPRTAKVTDYLFRLLRLILIGSMLAGCGGNSPLLSPEAQSNALPLSVELSQTPFFPQEDYQCAPAALATVLAESGADVAPDDLVARVFIPGRRGSLQVELLAATRTFDRLPYVIQPELGVLMAEVVSGRPVLILQNLGPGFAPVWHYAVVVGYDAGADHFILRSGAIERRVMPASKFARAWTSGDNWAMVVLRPGELPAMPVEADYLQAAAALEAVGRTEAARAAFQTAVAHWPQSSAALFGLANAYYASGELADAEQAYRALLKQDPADSAALNNLAQVLLDQGRCTEASEELDRALAHANPHLKVQDTFAATRAAINSRCGTKSTTRPEGT